MASKTLFLRGSLRQCGVLSMVHSSHQSGGLEDGERTMSSRSFFGPLSRHQNHKRRLTNVTLRVIVDVKGGSGLLLAVHGAEDLSHSHQRKLKVKAGNTHLMA